MFNGSLDISERDYATLDKSARSPIGPVVPGITSTPAAGYGGSLPRGGGGGNRQYPPPPDFFAGGGGGGGDGEPQIVGNLS